MGGTHTSVLRLQIISMAFGIVLCSSRKYGDCGAMGSWVSEDIAKAWHNSIALYSRSQNPDMSEPTPVTSPRNKSMPLMSTNSVSR